MAAQNRDELQTQIDSTFVATLAIANHRSYLKDPQAESLVFRKDVIASETPSGGTVTVDYSNKDLATASITANLTVSFSGMENGDVKYLLITKSATNTVSFSGANDMVRFRDLINTELTSILYRITNKNNVIYVEDIYNPADTSFTDLTLASNWSGYAKYRINKISGKIELEIKAQMTTSGGTITTLPSAIRPDRFIDFMFIQSGSLTTGNPIITNAFINSSTGDIQRSNTDNNGGSFPTSTNFYAYIEYYISLP